MPENVIISEDYRNLTVPQDQLILGCVGDAWVRRVYFTAPRYCDGTDLSGYDFTVQFINEAGVSDLYEVEDLATVDDTLTFSWLVSPIACANVGKTEVSVIASNVDDETGETLNRFLTTTYPWEVLPSTTAEDGELIEAQSYVEMRVAEWQAVVDTNTAAIASLSDIIPASSFSSTNTVKSYIDKCDKAFDTVADMQADTTLSAGMICHTLGFYAAGDGGGAWYKIAASGDIALDNGLYATGVNMGGAKTISIDQLETATNGIYSLGEIEVTSPITLNQKNNRNIIIVDTVFKINTSVLFPSNTEVGSYFILPSFVGCTFENATSDDSRVFIAGGEQIVPSKITGCNFINVDFVNDSTYLQDMNIAECYIQSHTCFIDLPSTTTQARFVNCTCESESKQLIKTQRLIGYLSGTYEGNASQSSYLIECERAKLELNSCYFELEKVLYVKNSTHVKPSSFIKLDSCITNGHDITTYSDYPFKFIDPSAVILTIINTSFSGYLGHIINNSPDEFYKVYGAFFQINPTAITPFASSDKGKRLATQDIRNTLHVNGSITFNAAAIDAGTTLDIELETGIWFAIAMQVSAGKVNEYAQYLISGGYEAGNSNTNIIELRAPAGWLQGITLTATKPSNTSPKFTLSIGKTGNPIGFAIGLIKVVDRNYNYDY